MKTEKCEKCSAHYPEGDAACPSCLHENRGEPNKLKKPLLAATSYLALIICVLGVLWIFGAFTPKELPRAGQEEDVKYDAKSLVRQNLKDPDSANFGELRQRSVADGKYIVCGSVNSKNSFGGYTGFKNFIYTHARPSVTFSDGGDDFSYAWDSLCR